MTSISTLENFRVRVWGREIKWIKYRSGIILNLDETSSGAKYK
jgi:hypothetical protein